MNYKDFDIDNLFENEFTVDPNLIKGLLVLRKRIKSTYSQQTSIIIIQGARTEESNKGYYQNKYGEEWKRFYNKNSLHVVKPETGNILRAADVGFELEDRYRLTGEEIYRIIQKELLFGNVGISNNYVHVDTLIRVWHYKN